MFLNFLLIHNFTFYFILKSLQSDKKQQRIKVKTSTTIYRHINTKITQSGEYPEMHLAHFCP